MSVRFCCGSNGWSGPVAALALLIGSASPAAAHFVWVTVEKHSAGDAAHVYFSELAEADDAELLDKIASVKVWTRSASGAPQPITLARQTRNGGGAWVGAVSAGTSAVAAHLNYGVLSKRGETFLLHYHAKYLDQAAATDPALARDSRLVLDLVPEFKDQRVSLAVLFEGKPVSGAEVVGFDPAAAETKGQTDASGRVTIETKKPGLYSIRAKWVVKEAGRQDGQEYPQVYHYSTLALRVPGGSSAAASATQDVSAEPSASRLLRQARDARAVWADFPGFEADATVLSEGRRQQGKIHVTADGQVLLTGIELENQQSLLGTLRSLVAHRLSSSEANDSATFADVDQAHPLGRLIRLEGDAMASAYRIKDDVIREVNREIEGGRFTISVFDVNRNPEGKYLPGYYTVTTWNKDGSLRSSSVIRETWNRVGRYDLPATYDALFVGAGEHRNVSVIFENHKLAKGK